MNNSEKLKGTLLQNFTPLGKDTVSELQVIDVVAGDGEEVPEKKKKKKTRPLLHITQAHYVVTARYSKAVMTVVHLPHSV